MAAVEKLDDTERRHDRLRIQEPSPAVSAKTWLAVVGATLGAFLAVLNIQIVNAALPDIQGAIGAGIDDGGWISTAYLVTEIIVIPLSGCSRASFRCASIFWPIPPCSCCSRQAAPSPRIFSR
jgi:DHA2 family multidrug resistance protein